MAEQPSRPIRLTAHAASDTERRGFSVAEVETTVHAGLWLVGRAGRLEPKQDCAFGSEWNGHRVILVDEPEAIAVITVNPCCF